MVDPKILQIIVKALLDAGSLQSYWGGDELQWQRDQETVVDRFLSLVADQSERRWEDVCRPTDQIWSSALTELEANDRLPAGRLTADQVLRSLSALGSYSAEDFSRAMRATNAVLQTAWLQVFAEGRILVFRRLGDRWEFEPPTRWQKTPPFPGLTTDEILSERARELRSRKAKEVSDAIARYKADAYDDIEFGQIQKIADEQVFMDAKFSLELGALDGILTRAGGFSDGPERCYLFSGDLPPQLLDPAGGTTLTDKAEPEKKPRKKKQRYGPRDEILAKVGKRLIEMEYVPNSQQAAIVVIGEHGEIAEGFGSYASKLKRIRDHINRLIDQ